MLGKRNVFNTTFAVRFGISLTYMYKTFDKRCFDFLLGFVSKSYEMRYDGGEFVGKMKADQCQRMCLERNDCVAVDFKEHDDVCYLHKRNTYCRQSRTEERFIHLSRIPCTGMFT